MHYNITTYQLIVTSCTRQAVPKSQMDPRHLDKKDKEFRELRLISALLRRVVALLSFVTGFALARPGVFFTSTSLNNSLPLLIDQKRSGADGSVEVASRRILP